MGQMSIDKASFAEAEVKCLSLQLIKGVLSASHRCNMPTLNT